MGRKLNKASTLPVEQVEDVEIQKGFKLDFEPPLFDGYESMSASKVLSESWSEQKKALQVKDGEIEEEEEEEEAGEEIGVETSSIDELFEEIDIEEIEVEEEYEADEAGGEEIGEVFVQLLQFGSTTLNSYMFKEPVQVETSPLALKKAKDNAGIVFGKMGASNISPEWALIMASLTIIMQPLIINLLSKKQQS